MIAVAERLADFLRRRKYHPFCVQCMSDTLGYDREDIRTVMAQLSTQYSFVHDKDDCSECGSHRETIKFIG